MNMALCYIGFWIALILSILHVKAQQSSTSASKLIEQISKNQSKAFIPGKPVNVTFGFELVQITDFNEREEILKLKTWMRMRWKNKLLSWSPEEWGGVKEFRFNHDVMWVPDVQLYNTGEELFSVADNYKNEIGVSYDGNCTWLNPVTFRVLCNVDLRHFPFDRQHCTLNFGSWTYDVSKLNMFLDPAPIVTPAYQNSSEWKLQGINATKHTTYYNCCPLPYAHIDFHIDLLRKPKYYVVNVIVPCILIVTIILFGFYLPVESGERIALVIIVLLIIVLFMQMINDKLPKNSDTVAILTVFYLAIMTESMISLLLTFVTLSIHYRGDSLRIKRMPKWARTFFIENFAKWYGMEQDASYFQLRTMNNRLSEKEKGPEHPFVSNMMKGTLVKNNCAEEDVEDEDENRDSFFNVFMPEKKPGVHKEGKDDRRHREIVEELQKIHTDTKTVCTIISERESHEFKNDEWKYLAQLVDRFFFCVFLLAVTVTTVAILVPASQVNY